MGAESPAYTLHSELAQFCLPSSQRDRNQKLAWTNSICLLFLVIGLVGLKPPLQLIKKVPPLEELAATVIEPTPPPPAQEQPDEQPQEQTEEETTDAPRFVAVTLDSPSINFSVPTVGNLLVAAAVAQAPPANPMRPVETVTNRIQRITTTGRSGDHPSPDYPQWALRDGMKGAVVVLISVDATGAVTNVDVEKSCGYPRLDRYSVEHVKKRFVFPSADSDRQFRLEMEYSPR